MLVACDAAFTYNNETLPTAPLTSTVRLPTLLLIVSISDCRCVTAVPLTCSQPPAVTPSCTRIECTVESTVTSPTGPVYTELTAVLPRFNSTCLTFMFATVILFLHHQLRCHQLPGSVLLLNNRPAILVSPVGHRSYHPRRPASLY